MIYAELLQHGFIIGFITYVPSLLSENTPPAVCLNFWALAAGATRRFASLSAEAHLSLTQSKRQILEVRSKILVIVSSDVISQFLTSDQHLSHPNGSEELIVGPNVLVLEVPGREHLMSDCAV